MNRFNQRTSRVARRHQLFLLANRGGFKTLDAFRSKRELETWNLPQSAARRSLFENPVASYAAFAAVQVLDTLHRHDIAEEMADENSRNFVADLNFLGQ